MGWTSFTTQKTFEEVLREDIVTRNYNIRALCIKYEKPEEKEISEQAVMYAAIQHPKGYTFGLVVLINDRVENGKRREIFYKEMDESQGPNYYDCPESVLSRLSPVESLQGSTEYAKGWRDKCRARISQSVH